LIPIDSIDPKNKTTVPRTQRIECRTACGPDLGVAWKSKNTYSITISSIIIITSSTTNNTKNNTTNNTTDNNTNSNSNTNNNTTTNSTTNSYNVTEYAQKSGKSAFFINIYIYTHIYIYTYIYIYIYIYTNIYTHGIDDFTVQNMGFVIFVKKTHLPWLLRILRCLENLIHIIVNTSSSSNSIISCGSISGRISGIISGSISISIIIIPIDSYWSLSLLPDTAMHDSKSHPTRTEPNKMYRN
jgi:hypothetical protein